MIIVDTQNNSDLKYEAQTPSGCKVIAILVDHQKVLLLIGTPVVLVNNFNFMHLAPFK